VSFLYIQIHAGKTTAVSLLTGLFPPTSGDCIIYGDSIVSDLVKARRSIGICPQENILFDRLTVFETITFFRRIKGIRSKRADVKAQAEEVGLNDFFHTTASALSGGNKRKLSLAIALCGDPKFLVLDGKCLVLRVEIELATRPAVACWLLTNTCYISITAMLKSPRREWTLALEGPVGMSCEGRESVE
jgi:ABC-type Na+ transport system ATPase subunit NatA